jgi:formylglycine-generating enzyme required for sulfatase activity
MAAVLVTAAALFAVKPMRHDAPDDDINATAAAPVAITLASPLNTLVPCPLACSGYRSRTLTVTVTVPADAPADLGIGAWTGDLQGHWCQSTAPGILTPGTHRLSFHLASGPPADGPHGASAPATAARSQRCGLVLWSSRSSATPLMIGGWSLTPWAEPQTPSRRLNTLHLGGLTDDGGMAAHTGEAWTCSVIPEPFPADTDDRDGFALDALITAADGSRQRVAGVYMPSRRRRAESDTAVQSPDGEARFAVCWRPHVAGFYTVQLTAHWGGDPYASAAATAADAVAGATPDVIATLPELVVTGSRWNGDPPPEVAAIAVAAGHPPKPATAPAVLGPPEPARLPDVADETATATCTDATAPEVATPATAADTMDPVALSPWASAHGTDAYGSWADLTVNGVVQRFRWIPAGTFIMGCDAAETAWAIAEAKKTRGAGMGYQDPAPQHQVTLTNPYWLADSSCTQELWQAVMGTNPACIAGNPRRPVEQVSWNDCQRMLAALNTLDARLSARLPSEAEWEYACRAGTTGRIPGARLDALAWYQDNSNRTSRPVKTKAANPWGLYDMIGNVWQWCGDYYGDYPTAPLTDPTGPTSGLKRVVRGGGWMNGAGTCRAAERYGSAQNTSVFSVGFRICLPARSPSGNVMVPATITLATPLTTLLPCPLPRSGPQVLGVTVTVPAGAPADLGIGAFAMDQQGRWYQCTKHGPLTPGTHRLTFHLAGAHAMRAEGSRGDFDPATAAGTARCGVFLWSSATRAASVTVSAWSSAASAEPPAPPAPRLTALHIDGLAGDVGDSARTGERWTCTVIPQPFPANPYDRGSFALDCLITAPDGSRQRIPGFYLQPMRGSDRGDREDVVPDGEARFAVRWRPSLPGRYTVQLSAQWGGDPYAAAATAPGRKDADQAPAPETVTISAPGDTATAAVSVTLPEVQVTGKPWDGFVRVDRDDPRFLAVDGRWFWPTGPNLRSIWDQRSREHLATIVTPDRGTASWDAYLDRLGANHANAAEIWLSSWGLGLEWRADWPGYHGCGRFNEAHAWQLDRILDRAQQDGVRVLLVIANHGQASSSVDAEWKDNPWNADNGGPLVDAGELFTDARALAGQERLRTYLIARYADHPALLGWKLWSEVDLTDVYGPEPMISWHEQAAARWHALDTYGHPVTTHWSGDWHGVYAPIARLRGIDLLSCDAYHGPYSDVGNSFAEQMAATIGSGDGPAGGLAQYRKPVLVSEYGGNWDACPLPQLEAEHACGPWLALVSGQGAGPMLWWFEWVDQGARFAPYRAIAAFLAGEDARGADAHSLPLTATSAAGKLWARAWSRPGRMLGYVLDLPWSGGISAARHGHAQVGISANFPGGRYTVEWWDADHGTISTSAQISHAGGALTLSPPPFVHHCAFKLIHVPEVSAPGP